jgi:MYXO-CTERM domain-containing protein
LPALVTFAAPARAVSSAEFYQSQAEVYGRFEARIRFAPGDGVVSSFFLWKAGSEMTGAYWNELDFEKLGADCHLQTNAIFGAPSVQHSQTNPVTDACGEYHTYGYEWAPSYISWQIDGVEVRRDTDATATAFAQNATAGMQIHFNIWPGDATFGGNFDPGILPVSQYISWVQYSAFENGTFSLSWREDFDAASVPSGWLTGNWASPKNLSTHSPANVNFVDGISILSLTNDNATGFTGTPPSDDVDGGSGGSGAGGGPSASGGIGTGSGGATLSVAGQSAGNAGGTGPSSAGTGGAGDAESGSGASGGASVSVAGATGSAHASGSSSGCSCRVPTNGRSSNAAGLAALAAMSLVAGRRRWTRTRR